MNLLPSKNVIKFFSADVNFRIYQILNNFSNACSVAILLKFWCFSGSENRYRHEFNGYLAGLSYLANAVEHTEVLRCLHQCAESLQVCVKGHFFSNNKKYFGTVKSKQVMFPAENSPPLLIGFAAGLK